jgi:hypothetical protein
MADVEVKCEECGAPVVLSEYAAMETISCRACGAPLRTRTSAPTDSVRERLKLRPQPPPPAQPPAAPPAKGKAKGASKAPPPEEEIWRLERYIGESRARIKDKPKSAGLLLSWLCFMLLAAGMAYARYFGAVTPGLVDAIKTYGPYVTLAIHAIIMLTAFKDSVFQGILCLLIPGYSFIYLFTVSDNFWMRAICGGLLVGVAYDSALYYRDVAATVYNAVTRYIASGG